jgi:hypothetical protein
MHQGVSEPKNDQHACDIDLIITMTLNLLSSSLRLGKALSTDDLIWSSQALDITSFLIDEKIKPHS